MFTAISYDFGEPIGHVCAASKSRCRATEMESTGGRILVQSPTLTVAIVAHCGRTSREITSAQTPNPQRVPRSGRSCPACHRGQTCCSKMAHRAARLAPSSPSSTSKVAWTARSIRLSS